MPWSLGGILLWLGGWWFTGRMFGVYRKAIYLEEADDRRHGQAFDPPVHRVGLVVFSLIDLGLLLIGICCLTRLRTGVSAAGSMASLASAVVEWSLMVCLYFFRQGFYLHRFYHDRWRARARHLQLGLASPGTPKGLWHETSTGYRVLFFMAPLCAAVPLGTALLGEPSHRVFYLPGEHLGPFFMWFLLPQTLLLLALLPPLLRLRRLARAIPELEQTGRAV